MKKGILALTAALLFGTGCGQDLGWAAVERAIEAQHPDVRPLSTDSLAAWLGDASAAAPLLLDVRQPEEYRVSHLAGARRVDPGADNFSFLSGVDKNRPIVAYCSVGYRSAALSERLMDAGFTNVYNLKGSIFAWANEGRPVYREGRRVREVHPYDRTWGALLDDSLHASL